MELAKIQKEIRENNKKLSSSGWLLNQYPLIKDRLLKENYLNFHNLEFWGDKINLSEIERFLKETNEKIVILSEIDSNLKQKKPIILVGNSAEYYPQYELFRESLNPKPFGWIEIFHNFKEK